MEETLNDSKCQVLIRPMIAGNRIPKNFQAIIFDFDGVFTDNSVIVDEEGKESVVCNRSDGIGISAIIKKGIPILVISKEKNLVVQKRCDKLGIPCIQGIDDKWGCLSGWLQNQGFDPKKVIYVGNDVNDIECLQSVGCGVAVADAYDEVKKAATIILINRGGHGAVRELCDLVISSKWI